MIKSVDWKGLTDPTFENCTIAIIQDQLVVSSQIVGTSASIPFEVQYVIYCSSNWEVSSFCIDLSMQGEQKQLKGRRDSANNWAINGQLVPSLQTCIDIDISLTPFTNSLPINRLTLQQGDSATIDVLYIDVFRQTTKLARQTYTHVDMGEYHYHNHSSGFQSAVYIDADGLVTRYPNLFERQ